MRSDVIIKTGASGWGSGRGRHTRGVALNSMTGECSGLWLAKYKHIASQSPD